MDEQNARAPKPMLKAIFFDAVGTLFYLTKTVGDHYAFVGEEVGLSLNARKLDAAFHSAWKQMPPREAINGPRDNDDKDWWRELANLVLEEAAPTIDELDRDNFFEVASSNCDRALSWRSFQTLTADCALFWSVSAFRNISATPSSRARSAPTNPTPKFSVAPSSFSSCNPATSCTSVMIPSATGKPLLAQA